MRLKPKNTTLNPRALLYKRFTSIEKASTLNSVYKTVIDNKFWTFNAENLSFAEITTDFTPVNVINVISNSTCLSFSKNGTIHYFKYQDGWQEISSGDGLTLLSATYNNVGNYQTNKYYFSGTFSYIKKGAVEGSTTQYIKGNIIPLDAFSIQYYDDYINIEIDDLVVINGRLYSVQNPITDHKHQPKDYTIYSVDLMSVL